MGRAVSGRAGGAGGERGTDVGRLRSPPPGCVRLIGCYVTGLNIFIALLSRRLSQLNPTQIHGHTPSAASLNVFTPLSGLCDQSRPVGTRGGTPRPTASSLPPAARRRGASGCLTVLHTGLPAAKRPPAPPAGCPPSTFPTCLDGPLLRVVCAAAFCCLLFVVVCGPGCLLLWRASVGARFPHRARASVRVPEHEVCRSAPWVWGTMEKYRQMSTGGLDEAQVAAALDGAGAGTVATGKLIKVSHGMSISQGVTTLLEELVRFELLIRVHCVDCLLRCCLFFYCRLCR